MKANTWEAGADVKEGGLLSGASHLEDGGLTLNISGQAEVFTRRGRGQNTENDGGGWKVLYVQTSTVHSDKTSDGLVGVILL